MSAADNTNTASSSISNAVKGSGAWAPGTTVREIEGHFHKENEPKDVEPISKDGGVPNVDFAGKIKDAVTGHHDKKDVAETK